MCSEMDQVFYFDSGSYLGSELNTFVENITEIIILKLTMTFRVVQFNIERNGTNRIFCYDNRFV